MPYQLSRPAGVELINEVNCNRHRRRNGGDGREGRDAALASPSFQVCWCSFLCFEALTCPLTTEACSLMLLRPCTCAMHRQVRGILRDPMSPLMFGKPNYPLHLQALKYVGVKMHQHKDQ